MKWPWTKTQQDVMQTDSARAIVEAEEHLAEVQSHWAEVHDVSRSLRELVRKNHFAESIERLYGGKA